MKLCISIYFLYMFILAIFIFLAKQLFQGRAGLIILQTLGVAHKNLMTRCGLTRLTIKTGVVCYVSTKSKAQSQRGDFPEKFTKKV